ncbi:hypothetical protein PIB30_043825 [Stylosanthes scabra]|uniref:Uncharacterized protein n=1 Tax=Stylosanthes scabra TaxID=79078 RepID=A0ABU6VEF4_9FABA|nr:hypothetical protein [Stylosanthes scabra]
MERRPFTKDFSQTQSIVGYYSSPPYWLLAQQSKPWKSLGPIQVRASTGLLLHEMWPNRACTERLQEPIVYVTCESTKWQQDEEIPEEEDGSLHQEFQQLVQPEENRIGNQNSMLEHNQQQCNNGTTTVIEENQESHFNAIMEKLNNYVSDATIQNIAQAPHMETKLPEQQQERCKGKQVIEIREQIQGSFSVE